MASAPAQIPARFKLRFDDQAERDHENAMLEAPMVSLCGHCDFRYEGTAAECLAASAAHRAEQHPWAKDRNRRRPGRRGGPR